MSIMPARTKRKPGIPARMKAEHFANLRPDATVVFPDRKVIWKVERVVERGAVLYRADDGSHKHLAEWHQLALATFY